MQKTRILVMRHTNICDKNAIIAKFNLDGRSDMKAHVTAAAHPVADHLKYALSFLL